jgi:hypothetical protein
MHVSWKVIKTKTVMFSAEMQVFSVKFMSLVQLLINMVSVKDAAPHVRLCGKFITQPHVRCTCGARAARTGTKDVTPHVRLYGELTTQPHVRSPCDPVRHPWSLYTKTTWNCGILTKSIRGQYHTSRRSPQMSTSNSTTTSRKPRSKRLHIQGIKRP